MKFYFLFFLVLTLTLTNAQPSTWSSSGLGGGGSLFAPSISPVNSSIMYMQCDMSEVFHTSDAGIHWQPIHFKQLISTGGTHPVVFTNDPSILYTVNYGFLDDTRFPVKSVDGGNTWNQLASDPTGGDVWFISSDPNSTQRIIISSYTAMYLSVDGGNTFSLKYNHGSDFLISGVFWDGNDIYIGTQIGLIVSHDGGVSFALDSSPGIPAGYGFMSFTGSKSNGITRLMGTIAAQDDLYPGVNALDIDIYSSIIRIDYGTTGWTNAVGGINPTHNLFYIASALNNSSVFYVGGTNPNTSYPVIYKTSDGGNSWAEVFLTVNNQNISTGYSGYQGDEDWWYGEIVFGLAVAPNDPQTVIYTDFGFAHISTDGGTNWRQSYVASEDQNPAGSPTAKGKAYGNNGLENTSCWNMHWCSANEDIILASYTDITATKSIDGGIKWSFDFNGINYNTVYHIIEHPTNGTLYAATSSVHDIYQSTYLTDSRIDGGTGAILYSTDQGLHWNLLHNFNHPVIWLAIDPKNNNRMYASVVHSTAGGIYLTSDLNNGSLSNWSSTSKPARTEGHPYNVFVLNDGTVVTTWSGRRTSGGFTASSGVFASSDQGATWTDLSDRPNMDFWTKDITIDPNDANQNTWYVSVFSGWGGPSNGKGGLYKTSDRGVNWTKIFNGYRVESCTVDPVNASKIFVTTENEGLWYSSNANSASPSFTQQDSYPFMHPMRVLYNPNDFTEIWVTSFGNGIKVGSAPSIPLAIHNLQLDGKGRVDGNSINWSFDEITEPLARLSIQRSEDGYRFEEIYRESRPKITSGQFFDRFPSVTSYYRIEFFFMSGKSGYSNILTINNEHIDPIQVYPNITEDLVHLEFPGNLNNLYQINVVNAAGIPVKAFSHSNYLSGNKATVSLRDLPGGFYIIRIMSETGFQYSVKIFRK
ncbi:MAG: T9SS type A sorting domain-containing protein [Saprospiraceae bacterium]|nr:T9SS type A sorting domain-containing protein [Saprospiraceae bacterium]